MGKKAKDEKTQPWYKKWWSWMIIGAVVIAIIGGVMWFTKQQPAPGSEFVGIWAPGGETAVGLSRGGDQGLTTGRPRGSSVDFD